MSCDDIEAISALARIPRTADGPDWSAASPIDTDLATKLISKEWQYADRVARSALRERGGAVPYEERERVEPHVDDPGDDYDDAKFAEHRPLTPPRDEECEPSNEAWRDAHFDDVISNIWGWMHEAARKFDGKRGAWRSFLGTVISSRVADHLDKRLVAGTTLNKDDAPEQPQSLEDRIEDLELEGVFAAAADEVRAHLQVLCEEQDEFGVVVLRRLATYKQSYAEIAARAGKAKSTTHEKAQKLLAKLPALADAITAKRIIYQQIINNNDRLSDLSEQDRTIFRRFRIDYKRHRMRPTVDRPELVDSAARRWFEYKGARPNWGEKCRRPISTRELDEPGVVVFRGPYVYGKHRRQKEAVRGKGALVELSAFLASPIAWDPQPELPAPNGTQSFFLPRRKPSTKKNCPNARLTLAEIEYIARGRENRWAADSAWGDYDGIPVSYDRWHPPWPKNAPTTVEKLLIGRWPMCSPTHSRWRLLAVKRVCPPTPFWELPQLTRPPIWIPWPPVRAPHGSIAPFTRRNWISWDVNKVVLLDKQTMAGAPLYFVRKVTS